MTMEKQPHLDHVKTIGDFLREEREKRNIDLKTIAIRTKINFTILKELESNNYHKIPDKTYIRGFVKSYAKELGADVNEVLEYLDRTYTKKDKRAPVSSNNPLPTPKLSAAPVQPKKAVTTPEKKIQKNNPPKKEPGKLFSFYSEYKKEMLFLTVAIIFLSVVVSFITGKSAPKKVIVKADIITSQVKPATTPIAVLEKEETIPASMEPEKTLSNIPKPDPKIETHSKVVLTDTAKILKVEPAKSTETVKPMEETPVEPIEKEKKEDDASKKIAFRKIAVPIYSLNSSAPEINDRSILPANILASMTAGQENVYVRAVKGDTWITYKKDDDKIKIFTLREGENIFIQGKKILMFLGNFYATKIFYNKKLVEAKSTSGVKSLIFPESITGDYSLPLFIHHKGNVYTEAEYKKLSL